MFSDQESEVPEPGEPPMTLEGLGPDDRTVLFQKLGYDEYFKIVRRDAVRDASADVEEEIRLRSRMRQEARRQELRQNPSLLTRLRQRWSGES